MTQLERVSFDSLYIFWRSYVKVSMTGSQQRRTVLQVDGVTPAEPASPLSSRRCWKCESGRSAPSKGRWHTQLSRLANPYFARGNLRRLNDTPLPTLPPTHSIIGNKVKVHPETARWCPRYEGLVELADEEWSFNLQGRVNGSHGGRDHGHSRWDNGIVNPPPHACSDSSLVKTL